ncbi:MAG: hypothetical protein QM667_12255 [Asticcacaulis sp.]
MKRFFPVIAFAVLASGASAQTPAEVFFDQVKALCGQSFAGQVVSTDPADDNFRGKPLIMTVKTCSDAEIRIPFAVGEDRSRTWVITRLDDGRLRLKHDHRHADGVEDELSQYGGETAGPGTAQVQAFPVDAFSVALFTRTGRSVSNTNVWTMERHDEAFVYQLSRPNRLFRVSFDLTQPVKP